MIAKLVALAAATVIPLVGLPATAAADVDDYLYDMSKSGFDITADSELLYVTLGLGACVDLYNGASVRGEIQGAVEMGMKSTEAARLIQIAVSDLCPSAVQGGLS